MLSYVIRSHLDRFFCTSSILKEAYSGKNVAFSVNYVITLETRYVADFG